jgi:hypothetical protein
MNEELVRDVVGSVTAGAHLHDSSVARLPSQASDGRDVEIGRFPAKRIRHRGEQVAREYALRVQASGCHDDTSVMSAKAPFGS